nr:MAG TPA: hypothetical protein [Caudoviricetes sp.]
MYVIRIKFMITIFNEDNRDYIITTDNENLRI